MLKRKKKKKTELFIYAVTFREVKLFFTIFFYQIKLIIHNWWRRRLDIDAALSWSFSFFFSFCHFCFDSDEEAFEDIRHYVDTFLLLTLKSTENKTF